GILELIREHDRVRQQKYEVAVNDLGATGIEILIQVFFEVPDGHAELMARDELILDILRLAERLGISFDSPTMVLERDEGPENGDPRFPAVPGCRSPSSWPCPSACGGPHARWPSAPATRRPLRGRKAGTPCRTPTRRFKASPTARSRARSRTSRNR